MISLSAILRPSFCLPLITRRALHTSTYHLQNKAVQPQTPATGNVDLGAVCIDNINPIISAFVNLPF